MSPPRTMCRWCCSRQQRSSSGPIGGRGGAGGTLHAAAGYCRGAGGYGGRCVTKHIPAAAHAVPVSGPLSTPRTVLALTLCKLAYGTCAPERHLSPVKHPAAVVRKLADIEKQMLLLWFRDIKLPPPLVVSFDLGGGSADGLPAVPSNPLTGAGSGQLNLASPGLPSRPSLCSTPGSSRPTGARCLSSGLRPPGDASKQPAAHLCYLGVEVQMQICDREPASKSSSC